MLLHFYCTIYFAIANDNKQIFILDFSLVEYFSYSRYS